MSKNPQHIKIIGWNVNVSRPWRETLKELKVLIKEENPVIVVLMEATNLKGNLEGLGYQVVQLPPVVANEGFTPEDANIAILVRTGFEITKRGTLRMKIPWKGPKLGNPHDPRVYRWLRIKIGRRTLKLGGAHIPFGEDAVLESKNKLKSWASNTFPGRPTVLVLDANMSLTEFRETIAHPSGMNATGIHIDIAGYKNITFVSKSDLGHRGSDHPAVCYEFVL